MKSNFILKKIKYPNGTKKYFFLGIKVLEKSKNKDIKLYRILGVPLKFNILPQKNILSETIQTEYKVIKVPQNKLNFPVFKSPDVSIVIPVYNNYRYTKLCLQSILENTENVAYEVIIADDNSTDETKNIKDEVDNIKVIRNKENLRFLKNCNNASKSAKGKYILFLNNDTQVQKDWLYHLVEYLENNNDVGLVGSKLIYPDGTLQEAGGIIYSDASGCNYGRNKNPDDLEYNYVKETDYISGACIMLKKSLWDELGGFDDTFAPAYYEDTDLAFQIRYKKGLKVVYIPKSVVVHFEGKSNGTDLSSGQKKYQVTNREKFFEKWKDELRTYHVNSTEGVLLSRDRGQNKKNILVIDWGVLTFSKDTGSRTTWQYMQFFKHHGFNVKFFPDSRKVDKYYLQQHLDNGFEVIETDFTSYISKYGKYFDYIYINRPNVSNIYIDDLRKYTRAKIIYQCHDLHYLRQYRERLLNKNPEADSKYQEEKDFEFSIFRKMDVTCTFSYDEVKILEKEDKYINAKQIPLFILDAGKMDQYQYIPKNRKDIIFVAGFGHAPNVDAAVWFVKEVLPDIKKCIPDIRLYLVGSKPTEKVLALQSDNIIVTGFVTDEELEEIYSKTKLVVCPLRYGAGVKGKVIEAIYHKVPVITTSIGIEGINNEDNIIDVKDDPLEFAECVIKRYNDNKWQEQQTSKYNKWIERYFSEKAVYASLQEYINFSNNKEN